MKRLWCLFRRRFAAAEDKMCVAFSETEGRVRACPYATEEEAKAKCPEYAQNTRHDGEDEGVE